MSDVVWVALIAAVPATIAAVVSWTNRKSIQEVHVMMNSRFTEMLRVAVVAAEARGHLAASTIQEQEKK